ncbi:membrane protein [Candidatus Photodesmus katoptron]|uniref:Efflux transporter, MFP subunit n=1 Tax=Candidatus Photodesmus katoptron Akat1 TaxID=1236703 RepID=S3DZL2_9GAMM|nr:efflux RND transporter periplasmic adaptor subunit [Candidatus Photodesmus katoptron]EPE37371.1 efflux transporter, MFP subunit [Candidatus Photodesmus katoptron Akat1]KEY90779.1 membrane protein [Candidatus Photodesmus katoptron]
MIKKIITFLVFYILVLTVHAKKSLDDFQRITVVTGQVQVNEIPQSLSLYGKLKSNESVLISSEITGKVDEIAIKENQVVKQGQLLFRLDDSKIQESIREAKVHFKNQNRILKEFKQLLQKGAITKTKVDYQKANVEIAKSRLAAHEVSLKQFHIIAPFSGTIGLVDLNRGELVRVGDKLFTLDNLSIMQLDVQVPEIYLSMINVGMEVIANTNAWKSEQFVGKVTAIDSHIDKDTLTLTVRIHFENNFMKLKPGMLMSVNMLFSPIKALVIPVEAIEYSGTKRFVYIVDKNSKAIRTEVVLGSHVGNNSILIKQGLQIGQKIIVQGIVKVRDGMIIHELN